MGYKHHCQICKVFLYEEAGNLIIPRESGIRLCEKCEEETPYFVFRHPDEPRVTCITTVYHPHETIFAGSLENCIQKMQDENNSRSNCHPFSGFNAGKGEF